MSSLKPMYRGIPYSPPTHIVIPMGPGDKEIHVDNSAVFPAAPSLAVIGIDENAETIRYGLIEGNVLREVTRGVQGAASSWLAGAPIARNFTEKDHGALIDNILQLDQSIAGIDLTPLQTQIGNVDNRVTNIQNNLQGQINTTNTAIAGINATLAPLAPVVFTIPATSWQPSTTYPGFEYQAVVSDSRVAVGDYTIPGFDMSSIVIAEDAGVPLSGETGNGTVTFFAEDIPESSLHGMYVLFKGVG